MGEWRKFARLWAIAGPVTVRAGLFLPKGFRPAPSHSLQTTITFSIPIPYAISTMTEGRPVWSVGQAPDQY